MSVEHLTLLIGLAIGWLFGYGRGVRACMPRKQRADLRAVLSRENKRLGSLGNVRRAAYAPDGRAGNADAKNTMDPPDPMRGANGEVLAPTLSQWQRIPLTLVRDEAP